METKNPVGRPKNKYKHSINGIGIPAGQFYKAERHLKNPNLDKRNYTQRNLTIINQRVEQLKSLRTQIELLRNSVELLISQEVARVNYG